MAFRSRDAVRLIRERLEAEAGRSLENLFEVALPCSLDRAQSLHVLDALLGESDSPVDTLLELEGAPHLATALFKITGEHASLAAALAQFPREALILLNREERRIALEPDALVWDGHAFVASHPESTSLRPFKLQRLAILLLLGEIGEWNAVKQDEAVQVLANALVRVLAERLWLETQSVAPCPSLQEADFGVPRAFYESLADALRRLEDYHHRQAAGDKARLLDSILGEIRRRIQRLPATLLGPEARHPDFRAEVLRRLGSQGTLAAHWLDPFSDRSNLYARLVEDDRAFGRFQSLLQEGPSLIPALKNSLELTERLLSAEVDESFHADSRLRELPTSCSLNTLAETFSFGWFGACGWWLLDPNFDLGSSLSDLMDALLVHCAHRLYLDFDIIALGSYGRRELAPGSDADVLFLVQDPRLLTQTNQQAEDLLALTAKLHRSGAPVRLDLRMRSEAGGELVRTYSDFLLYELEEMQMWQRFELGMARGVMGSEEATAVVTKAAYAQPLTPERLKELLDIKRQIETSKLKPQYRGRDIKLGEGALGDLEWFVHIMEMRYPTATRAGEHILMEDRIRAMGRARLINAIEVHELLIARRHLLDLRNRLELLGIQEDVLPENPGKLGALAVHLDATDANDLLLRHERLTRTVRTIFTDGMESLKVGTQ